jgi:hypothetical protein
LVELHVLSSLRDKQLRVERIRSASQFIRGALKVAHPLATRSRVTMATAPARY